MGIFELENGKVQHWRDYFDLQQCMAQLPNAPSRRIAGMQPADMGNPNLKEIQSEQSVVVADYGALVVNNIPNNAPWYLPQRARSLLVGYLGSHPRYQPFGVQKFLWDPDKREFKLVWVNKEISSPSCVPIVSYGSNQVYLKYVDGF